MITGLKLTEDYFVKIWAIDKYGNEVTVDEINVFTPVEEPITKPSKPILKQLTSPTNQAEVIISGLADPGTFIDLYDNGIFVARLKLSADADGKFSQAFTFAEGDHTFTIKAVDAEGDESEFSELVSLTIDLTPPAKPIILTPKNGDVTEAIVTLIGVAEPFATIEIILDGGETFSVIADENGAWQFILPSNFALAVGEHSFSVRATDLAGNQSEAATLTIIVGEPTEPTEPIEPTEPTEPTEPSEPTEPTELTEIPVVTTETAIILEEIAKATELPGIPPPQVVDVTPQVTGSIFTFSGTALPNEDVVIYIYSEQAVIYTTKANNEGIWTIQHSQDAIELSPGRHTVFAIGLDTVANVKSRPSPMVEFNVAKSLLVVLYNYLNLPTTIIAIVVLVFAAGWLYRLSLKKAKV